MSEPSYENKSTSMASLIDPALLANRYPWCGELIQPERVRVWEDDFHILHISVDGQAVDDVKPALAFPVSGKADYLSFLTQERREVALVARPRDLDKESKEAVRRALEKMYYVPKITQIHQLAEKYGVVRWEVQTDCGYAVFEVVGRGNMRKLPDGRYLLTDVDGNRFEIPRVYDLDARSQLLIQNET